MFFPCLRLARVMSEANEYDNSAVQVGRGAGDVLADLRQPAGAPDAGRAGRAGSAAGALRLAARRARGAREAHDDAWRARRAREGAAAVDHQGHRVPRRTRPDPADAAPKRPPAGRPHRDRAGQRRGPAGASAARGLAGPPAARLDTGGAHRPAGGSSDPGEAEPVLTGAARNGRRRRMFSSLRVRNFRLFASGQVISNTGTWMQRVAQDWLVLELTHG